LWQLEDKVRALPSTAVLDLAKVAKEIAAKNDERMRIVREIYKAFGWNETPSEKIYGVP
jgi:mannitol/fructose-specific phosphotransferase system IIA component